MTVAIVYPAGLYGTYLEWCLTTLTSTGSILSPFNSSGNSHTFQGVNLLNFNGWKNFVSSGNSAPFARFHPKILKEHNLSENLDYVCNTADSVIYLYPSKEYVLLSINNQLTKIWSNWWNVQMSSEIDIAKVYQNWPVATGTPASQIPQWIQREFLSFYLLPAWFNQVEWYHPDHWSNPQACIVTSKDLLFNFEESLNRIQRHCNLSFTRPVTDLLPYHKENLKLQTHLLQDQLCKDIVESSLNNISFDWELLPFGSEIWIQWELRNRGFEIQCDGLDIFPTNSIQLRELLYSV